jgi:hypothetical protein
LIYFENIHQNKFNILYINICFHLLVEKYGKIKYVNSAYDQWSNFVLMNDL